MLDPILLVAVALVGGATAAVAPASAWATALVSWLVLRRRVSECTLLVALGCFAAAAWRARASVVEWERVWAATRAEVGPDARCASRARVESAPTVIGGAVSFVAELDGLECNGRPIAFRPRARLYGGPPDLRRGDVLEIEAQVGPVQIFRNRGLPDPFPAATRRQVTLSGAVLAATRVARDWGPLALSDFARDRARRRIDATFSPKAAPLARALVLGETDLSPEDDLAFRRSGLAHLLAVSGTHLVLAVATLVGILRGLLVRLPWLSARYDVGRVAALGGIPLALAYADFAGGSGSAWRAAWMLSAGFLARGLGRHPHAFRSLASSFLVGAVLDPLLAFDVSFLLSAGATCGLVVLGPRLSAPCKRLPTRPLRWLAASLATTASAMLPCAPLLALLSPELTLVGALANVIAAPVGELAALPLCLLHPLTSAWPALERGTALAASGALIFVNYVAHAAASVRWAALRLPPPHCWHFAVLATALIAMGVGWHRRRCLVLGALGLALVEIVTVKLERPRGKLVVQVLDVGQGDSILVDLPDGKLMLIDGGGFVGSPVDPGKSVIAPLLRARRRDRVDVVVLSHPHPDHFTGLSSGLSEVEVGELWDTGQGEAEGAGPVYAALLSTLRARGVPVRRPAELCGRAHKHAGLELRVLAPCPGFVPGRGGNDNSLVLRLAFGAHAALLSGDAEHEEEAELVEREGPRLRATFLKAGHHGSRTSSSGPFLRAVRPAFAALSCGVRNRFGHPHASTLDHLSGEGIHILRTDRSGSIGFETDGETAAVDVAHPFGD